MIWYDCILEKAITTTDALDNTVKTGEFETVKTTQARVSPFTVEELSADSRKLTHNQQRYIMPYCFPAVEEATHAVINGLRQTIVERGDIKPRWSTIICEAYKV